MEKHKQDYRIRLTEETVARMKEFKDIHDGFGTLSQVAKAAVNTFLDAVEEDGSLVVVLSPALVAGLEEYNESLGNLKLPGLKEVVEDIIRDKLKASRS